MAVTACADESTTASLLKRVQATLQDPFDILQKSWTDPSMLCGGRPAGVMGSNANGGWWGVTCDAEEPPCVKKLYLAGKSFRGEVRTVLAAVADAVGSTVEYLHLGSNRLTAPLPSAPVPEGEENGSASSRAANEANLAIFNFQALKYLFLDTNNIEAPLNDMAGSALMSDRSPPLKVFSMHQNRLTGVIPEDVGMLTGLEWLNLGWNRLMGPVPKELLELKNLKWCWLAANQLSGEFPGSGPGALRSALPQLRSLKIAGNERLRGCLPLQPCESQIQSQSSANAREAGREQTVDPKVDFVVEAQYTQVTDCSCPGDESILYPPYPPLPPLYPPPAPPPPQPPPNPAPSPPTASYVYLVRGNATLEGYTIDTFGVVEEGLFARGVAAMTGLEAETVSVTGVARAITSTTTGGTSNTPRGGGDDTQRRIRNGGDTNISWRNSRGGGGVGGFRRMLGGEDGDILETTMKEVALIDFVISVTDMDVAEAVVSSLVASSRTEEDIGGGASLILNALISAGLSSLVGLRVRVEPEVVAQQLVMIPQTPPPSDGRLPQEDSLSDFDFSGLSGFLTWPVAAWPWIWVLRDGRWFTVVQLFTALGTF